MSAFDPDQFLSQTVEQSNDTKITPCPAGEYPGYIKELKVSTGQGKDGSTWASLNPVWVIDDQSVREFLDRDEVTVKQSIFLDLTDSGTLDMGKGKNVGLGRLREALGLNVPGQAFSFQMLCGRPAKITVTHRVVGEDIYGDIKMVAKLG